MLKGKLLDQLIAWKVNQTFFSSFTISALLKEAQRFLLHPDITLRSDIDQITYEEVCQFGSFTLANALWPVTDQTNAYEIEPPINPPKQKRKKQRNILETVISLPNFNHYITNMPDTAASLATTSRFFYHHIQSMQTWANKLSLLGCTKDDLNYFMQQIEQSCISQPGALIDTDYPIQCNNLYQSFKVAKKLSFSPLSKLFLLSGHPKLILHALTHFSELKDQKDQSDILMVIATSGSVSAFLFALHHLGSIDVSPDSLMAASYHNNLRLFNYIVHICNLSIDTQDHDGWTAMHHITSTGNEKKLLHLKERGVAMKKTKRDEYPIHIAAKYGHHHAFPMLTQHHSRIENFFRSSLILTKTKDKQSISHNILLLAARHGKFDTLKYIIAQDYFAKLETSNQLGNLLQLSCLSGNKEIVRYLIENQGYSIADTNQHGDTAFHFAAKSGNVELLTYLYILNASLANATDNEGNTALFFGVISNSREAINYLITLTLDPNVKNNDGNTPLHIAAFRGHITAVMALLENNARRTIQNNQRKDALSYALDSPYLNETKKSMVKDLLESYMTELEAAPSAPRMMNG